MSKGRLRGLAGRGGEGDDAHDVALLHDQEILAIDAHLGAGPLAEQHPVAGLHVQWLDLAGLVAGAGAGGDDFALLGLLLGGVRDDDAALRLLLRVNAADNNPVVQRTELHGMLLSADVCRSRTWPSGTLIERSIPCNSVRCTTGLLSAALTRRRSR